MCDYHVWNAKCSFKKVHVLWMVDGCHLQVTMGPGTALNLNPVFSGEWLQCRTARRRNTDCLFETFIICITTSFTSITLKLFHCMYLISGYNTHTRNVCAGPLWHITHIVWWHSWYCLWDKSTLVCCCRLWLYFWGHCGTNWGIATFPCRLPEKANIRLDNSSSKLTVDEILISIWIFFIKCHAF